MKLTDVTARRHRCRNKWCPNTYTDVIGAGAKKSGAVCLPCLYAAQMVDQDQTIVQIEAVPAMLTMFSDHLAKGGWSWSDMKAAHARMLAAQVARTGLSEQ